MASESQSPPTIYTIGHSDRSLSDFLRILKAFGITAVADVRRLPRSRHNPQFNAETLPAGLAGAGIAYRHFPGLAGFRRPQPDSVNLGWRNTSFRAYADYMQTEEFAASLAEVIDLAQKEAVAILCAEAVPWRCHRSLIADALLVRGFHAVDILGENSSRVHNLPAWARVAGFQVTYPGGESDDEGH